MQHFSESDQPKSQAITAPVNHAIGQTPGEEGSGGNKVGEILELLRRRALVIGGVAMVMIIQSAWKLSQQPTTYFGDFQLLVEPVNANLSDLSNPDQAKNNNRILDYDTQLMILRSPALLNPIYKDLQKDFPNMSLDALLGNLEIDQLGATKIIKVSFKSTNQAQTLAVLKALSKGYLNYSLNERQTYLRQGLQFVDRQLKLIQSQVDDLQDQLQAFRQKHGFAQPDDRSAQLTAQLNSLDTTRLQLEQELFNLKTQSQTMQTEQGIKSLVAKDTGYQNLLAQLQAIDTQISTERTRFQDDNIVIQSLLQKRANITPLLQRQAQTVLQSNLAEIQVQIQQLEARIKYINTTKAQIEAMMRELPILTREYNNLNRQLEIAVNSLTGFLESRQSLQIQAAQSEIPWELVREPYSVPQSSDFTKALLNKIIMGLAVGVAIAFALDKIDGTFHTIDALKRKIKLPILGTLPFNQQVFLAQENSSQKQQRQRKLLNQLKQTLIKFIQQFSLGAMKLAIALFEEYDSAVEFFESLRVIHTNIQQIKGDQPTQVFIVSSAMVGDGKTTFAINWADTAAVMGQKVLLIDANFRKPEVHEFLNLDNQEGLNTLMENPHLKPISIVQQVFEGKAFYVLSAGPVHPINSMILNPQRLYEIIQQLRQDFDVIILDVPSILGLADATIFSRCSDALIMVMSLHKTSQFVLKNTLDELEQKNIPILGLVVNRQKGADPVLRATISQSSSPTFLPPPSNNTSDHRDAVEVSDPFNFPEITTAHAPLPTPEVEEQLPK